MTLGYDCSTQLRGVRQISPGNVVKPNGIDGGGRGSRPAAGASGPYASQYDRAADAPVPLSQYSVMLSRMWSHVRLPEGRPSTKARAILKYASVSWSTIQAARAIGESSKA